MAEKDITEKLLTDIDEVLRISIITYVSKEKTSLSQMTCLVHQ